MIDWTAHERAIKKNNRRRIHLTKLIHDVLPTNYKVHRDNRRRQTCPSCCRPDSIEDRDHLLRCSSEQRSLWRAQLITSITNQCAMLHTDPTLTRILTDGLHVWFHTEDTLLPTKYPAKYEQLIRQQNRIGWRQLFSGRLSLEWARHQNDHLFVRQQRQQDTQPAAIKRSDSRTGHTWAAAIIQAIWEQWFDVWTMRNAEVHGHDQRTRNEQRECHNVARLQEIYDNGHLLEPSVRDKLLYPTMEEHVQHSRHTLHNWLAIHEATIAQSIKQATKRAIHGVRSIKSYLIPGRPPDAVRRTTTTTTPPQTINTRAIAYRRQLQTQSPADP
jgi:hypothetical protein